MPNQEERIIRAISYIVTALILFGIPFVIGVVIGHIFW